MWDALFDVLLWNAVRHAEVAMTDTGVCFIIEDNLCMFFDLSELDKHGDAEAELMFYDGEEDLKTTIKIILNEPDKKKILDIIH